MSNCIPAGWETASIGELASVLRGVTYKKAQSVLEERDGFVPLLRATNIDRELSFSDFVYVPRELVKDEQMLRSGDSVIAASSGSLAVVGKSAPLRHEWEGTFGAFCFALRPDPSAVVPLYLAHYLQTTEYRTAVSQLAAGVNINNLKRQHLQDMPIPFASKSEQHRIVEAIELYLTRLDAAVALLGRVQQNLKRYRASVLKAAVEGRLVPTEAELARKEGRSYEPASELLKRILDERRKRWIENAAEKARAKTEAKALKASKPWTPKDNTKALEKERAKAAKRYKEPAAPDTSNLPDLPEGWCWASWDQIGFAQNGRAFPSKEYSESGVKLLRPGNLHVSGNTEWTTKNTRYLPEVWARKHADYLIGSNELVMNLTAQSLADEFLGRICRTGAAERCLLNQRIARLKPLLVNSDFLLWLFKSQVFRHYVDSLNTGSLIQHMFTSQLRDFRLPLPPLTEQRRIAEAVDALMSRMTSIELSVELTIARIPVERQSILKWAFEGKLVEQDPNDEPASVLLERIKAERESMQSRKRRRTGKRKNVNTVRHDEQLDLLGGSNT